ncbi:hypothetical protein N7488_012396 [Penicillium malachiteum]|nr:hypothetical protein N7488_012396 [Penicillium malachiteum]
MSIPQPREGDVNIGTGTVIACWVLTGVVGLALLFRYLTKTWIRFWAMPAVTAPERIWGVEDLFFLVAYGFDLAHMSLIQMSAYWGLGRHFFYLSPQEKTNALKYDFLSQPFAVSSAMVSRTGMMWFLLNCFATNNRIRVSIVVCAIVQIVANMVTIVQIIVQCGPNPYRATDRVKYFHYMWTALPSDGSVVCQSPNVQTTVGFVQGGFNTIIDFFLATLAAIELWQFFLRTLHRDSSTSFWTQFRKINKTVRSRRIWQTITLSGPLILSGAASIIKTYKLKSLGDRNDFTYNIVSFVLWVKIENYSILLASCAPVARLLLRTVVDSRRANGRLGYFSRSTDNNKSKDTELKARQKDQWMDSATMTTNWDEENHDAPADWPMPTERSESRISRAKQPDHIDDGVILAKTDIVVQVDGQHTRSRSMSSGGTRLLPDGGEGSSEHELEHR